MEAPNKVVRRHKWKEQNAYVEQGTVAHAVYSLMFYALISRPMEHNDRSDDDFTTSGRIQSWGEGGQNERGTVYTTESNIARGGVKAQAGPKTVWPDESQSHNPWVESSARYQNPLYSPPGVFHANSLSYSHAETIRFEPSMIDAPTSNFTPSTTISTSYASQNEDKSIYSDINDFSFVNNDQLLSFGDQSPGLNQGIDERLDIGLSVQDYNPSGMLQPLSLGHTVIPPPMNLTISAERDDTTYSL